MEHRTYSAKPCYLMSLLDTVSVCISEIESSLLFLLHFHFAPVLYRKPAEIFLAVHCSADVSKRQRVNIVYFISRVLLNSDPVLFAVNKIARRMFLCSHVLTVQCLEGSRGASPCNAPFSNTRASSRD